MEENIKQWLLNHIQNHLKECDDENCDCHIRKAQLECHKQKIIDYNDIKHKDFDIIYNEVLNLYNRDKKLNTL